MQITIISDCSDPNARSRQEIRYRTLFGNNVPITFIGIAREIEASGCLIDAIDAHCGTEGIIIANVAPRGNKEKYPNGIPFCFSRVGTITIIGTPNCFSLAKKLGIVSSVLETDVLSVCKKFISQKEAQRIANSQFRSYEYLPLLAKWIFEKKDIPVIEISIPDFGNANYVWYVDCFGNCKTTLSDCSQNKTDGLSIQYSFIEKFADVPKDGKPYLIKGSSGYNKKRFLELVIQRQSASKTLGIGVGSKI